jgi:hypothetical protein
MADGGTRFVNDNIDAGNSSANIGSTSKNQSPYGVWGAMGSKAGGEAIRQ